MPVQVQVFVLYLDISDIFGYFNHLLIIIIIRAIIDQSVGLFYMILGEGQAT
jgi:hypothetical protein